MSDFDPKVAFARLDLKMDLALSEIAAVKHQTTLTNGRVTRIETDRAAELAVEQSNEKRAASRQVRYAWAPPAAVTCVVFVAGIAAERLL